MGGRMNDAADAVSAVKVSKLVKRYGDMLALDYFDLDVHQGEIFGLLGLTAQARPRRSTAYLRCSRSMRALCACSASRSAYQLCVEAAYRHCAAERGRVQRIDR